jgi:hypothetical protein
MIPDTLSIIILTSLITTLIIAIIRDYVDCREERG